MPNEMDDDLWRRVTKAVKPIRRRTGRAAVTSTEPSVDEPSVSATELNNKALTSPNTATGPRIPRPVVPPKAASVELGVGVAPGLDKRSLVKLRRGLIRPESRIDLHSMTQEQAHRALIGFVAASQTAGRRCVLVITGKGYGSEGMVGVLKTSVPRWLNEPVNRERVLAFTHATPGDGGDGALYVLLRRLRQG